MIEAWIIVLEDGSQFSLPFETEKEADDFLKKELHPSLSKKRIKIEKEYKISG